MINKRNTEILKEAYQRGKLIIVIGQQFTVPFAIPTLADLIIEIANSSIDNDLMPAVNKYVERGEYYKAVEHIKDFGDLLDNDMCEKMSKQIISQMEKSINDEDHNYIDLAQMQVSNILTTNYDLLITKYIDDPCVIPQIPNKVNVNTQTLFDIDKPTRVWHLNGHVRDIDSMVISKDKYNEVYQSEQFKKMMEIFHASGVMLFLGYSNRIAEIDDLLNENKYNIKSQHFIVLDRPDVKMKNDLKEKYNINTIEYNSLEEEHVNAIRRILNSIKADDSILTIQENKNMLDEDEGFVPIIPEIADRKKLEQNLFYKKLLIEKIDKISREFSQDCYFMADGAIRFLRKKGFTEDKIKCILGLAYEEYSNIRYKEYKHSKSSQLFLESVHSRLETYDFYKGIEECGFKTSKEVSFKLNPIQKQGFIHLVADNERKDVWWGEERNIELSK